MVQTKVLEYVDADSNVFEGFLAIPKSASANNKLPGVVIFHAFGGLGEFEKEKALDLAKAGYVALAADVYGKGIRGSSIEENFAILKPLLAVRTTTLKSRLLASFEALARQDIVNAAKIGTMGYCFGGLCSLDLARHGVDVKAVVSFHGTLLRLPDAGCSTLPVAVQIHHGDRDLRINEQISDFYEEMNERKVDWQFITYSNAEHGFTEPKIDLLKHPGVSYNEKADRRSWRSMLAFFAEILA